MTYAFVEEGHVATPAGFLAGVAACGIRYQRNDLALIISQSPCSAAALFTTNKVQAAHIHYDRAIVQRNTGGIRAVLINSGSANACTGQQGIAAAAAAARFTEETLALPEESVVVMSTGVIGVPLPVDKVCAGITSATGNLAAGHGPAVAHAIMTTDTRPKSCAVQAILPGGGQITIGGVAKGSGMIHPNMGTMLSVITTDAHLNPSALDIALRHVADVSFHCISVDGDTSTNDTVLALANGQSGYRIPYDPRLPDWQAFLEALTAVTQHLAQDIARDGEGANRLITISVVGAANNADAHRAAMTIACSPLVKTALFAADPNWGRVMCALGYSTADLDPERLTLRFGAIPVFEYGQPLDFDEQAVHAVLDRAEVFIEANLGLGQGKATVWTCDFSYEYVRINAEYRT